eukprot:3918471-Prymnesium_polylepis.1
MRAVYMYCFFMCMHLQLNVDGAMEWLEVTQGGLPNIATNGISKRTIYNEVYPIGDALAMLIDEVNTNDRYDPYNHA